MIRGTKSRGAPPSEYHEALPEGGPWECLNTLLSTREALSRLSAVLLFVGAIVAWESALNIMHRLETDLNHVRRAKLSPT